MQKWYKRKNRIHYTDRGAAFICQRKNGKLKKKYITGLVNRERGGAMNNNSSDQSNESKGENENENDQATCILQQKELQILKKYNHAGIDKERKACAAGLMSLCKKYPRTQIPGMFSLCLKKDFVYPMVVQEDQDDYWRVVENVRSMLTSFAIPGFITSIPDEAFEGFRKLSSVVIPNSVTSIGTWAFNECTFLTSVVIPTSVTSIGHCAFLDCTSLASVVIPTSVTHIGEEAFLDCSNLKDVYLPKSLEGKFEDRFPSSARFSYNSPRKKRKK